MYIYNPKDDVWYGYSTYTKPLNVAPTTKCYEYDTKIMYIWTGTEWISM